MKSAADPTDSDRAAFEAWALDFYGGGDASEVDLSIDSMGFYTAKGIEDAWEGWLARGERISLPTPAPETPSEWELKLAAMDAKIERLNDLFERHFNPHNSKFSINTFASMEEFNAELQKHRRK